MHTITPRQLDVLRLMARGLSNKLIARELGLSFHTVKRHVGQLLDRIDVGSRYQAVIWYARRAPGDAPWAPLGEDRQGAQPAPQDARILANADTGPARGTAGRQEHGEPPSKEHLGAASDEPGRTGRAPRPPRGDRHPEGGPASSSPGPLFFFGMPTPTRRTNKMSKGRRS